MTRPAEQERARQDLIDAVKAWREAQCTRQLDGELCDGDNHLMECPIERARQDILAAHNKVEQLKAG
jgi:hypothetical protein